MIVVIRFSKFLHCFRCLKVSEATGTVASFPWKVNIVSVQVKEFSCLMKPK